MKVQPAATTLSVVASLLIVAGASRPGQADPPAAGGPSLLERALAG